MFMVDIEAIIAPFISSLNRGTPVEMLLEPIMGENPDLDEKEVNKALLSHLKPTVTHIKSVSRAVKPKINTSKYRDTLTLKQYHKVIQCLTDIVEIVDKTGNGITKTGILRVSRRINSYWKPKYGRWLHELCDMGVIQTDNNRLNPRYYPHDAHVQNREREVHRRIAEALQIHGQMTMTQIAIKIGRNGGSNRSQVSLALEDLEREGFVTTGDKSRWLWDM
jgi:hypothetical protein